MSKKLAVKVEEYHIKCASRGTSESCPIALALTPLLPAGQRASVGFGWFGIFEGSKLLDTYELPQNATNFIRDFDNRRPVQPFEFEMEIS